MGADVVQDDLVLLDFYAQNYAVCIVDAYRLKSVQCPA